jgi:hypothetical protein
MTEVADKDDALEDAWLSDPPRRSRMRSVLVGVLAAALVFLAGVETQQRYGVGGASTSAAGPADGFTPPSGFPSGFPSGSASASTGTAAVIGKVVEVHGDRWTVKDIGGTTHQVTITGAKLVEEMSVEASAVKRGATVTVAGSTDDNGRITATTITVR